MFIAIQSPPANCTCTSCLLAVCVCVFVRGWGGQYVAGGGVGGVSAGGEDPGHGGPVLWCEAVRTGNHPGGHLHLQRFPLEALSG